MYLVVTEGPAAGVPGLNLAQLAAFMRSLGVRDAGLDDGGSTTIVGRLGKHIGLTLLNRPSDGSERPVADGLGRLQTIECHIGELPPLFATDARV